MLGERRKTAEALLRIYYEFPLTDAAIAAAAELEPLRDLIVRQGYKPDLGRAVQLYGARRYSDARAAFAALQGQVSGDDRELVDLRIAECDFFLQRYQAALDGVRPWLDRASRQAEARFFYLSALRGLGRDDEFLAQTACPGPRLPGQHLVRGSAQQPRHLLHPQQRRRARGEGFRAALREVPHRPARRARGLEVGLVGVQECATTPRPCASSRGRLPSFPRSDYRPLFLYWSARAHGNWAGADAESRLRLVVTDYGNSYYGRLAGRHLSAQCADRRSPPMRFPRRDNRLSRRQPLRQTRA